MDKVTLRARIQERLAATGKTAHAVSVEIGAGQGYVRDLLDPVKGGFPRADKLNALARALETNTDYLTGTSDSARQILSEVALAPQAISMKTASSDLPPIPLVGTGDCATIQLEDSSGELLDVERCSFHADHTIRMIARPPALQGARDLYAIYFQGESMMPRFEPGEVGIVDPTRPAGPGDYVLVQLNNGSEDHVTSVLVKRLVKSSPAGVVLEQFNPPAIFIVPRARVARIHRILPQTDLLFG